MVCVFARFDRVLISLLFHLTFNKNSLLDQVLINLLFQESFSLPYRLCWIFLFHLLINRINFFQCSCRGLDPGLSIQFFIKPFVQNPCSIGLIGCIHHQTFHCSITMRYSTIITTIHTCVGHLSKVLISLTIQLIYNKPLCRGLHAL